MRSLRRRVFLLFLTKLCLSIDGNAQQKDTLYFYNSTRIVGELLKISLGRVEFDGDGLGIISIKNSKIGSINATSRSFRVETLDGKEVQGYLARSLRSGMVVITTATEHREVRVDEIANLLYFGKSLANRVTGNVSAGYTYTKSSQIGRLNTDGLIKYNAAKGQTQLEGDMILTSDSISIDTERANLTFSHEHTIAPLWAIVGLMKYQRNVELGLQRRWQEAVGIGREFLITNHQQSTFVAGVAQNQERSLDEVEAASTEAMIVATYNLYSFINPRVTLSFAESAFISFTDKDRLRLDGDINLDYEVITDFHITLQFYHNFDSHSPATNEPNIDFGFVAGLRYKF